MTHFLRLGEVNADSLDFRVVLESIRSQLSAHARLLEAAERHLVVEGVVVVDPNGAVARRQRIFSSV